ncbi:MAG: hypothetical protein DME95_09020 [Verrucomicrobia bacterium]|nr:MAG: hypothetical protein DME95_09020 [Verrucomicrobiota bacterium]
MLWVARTRLAWWRARPRDRELSLGDFIAYSEASLNKSAFRRDTETSTRDACATHDPRAVLPQQPQ